MMIRSRSQISGLLILFASIGMAPQVFGSQYVPEIHNPGNGNNAVPQHPNSAPAAQAAAEERNCSVCQDTLRVADIHIRMTCNHEFHLHCILPWIRNNHNTCPDCRAPIEIYDPIDRHHRNGTTHLIGMNRNPEVQELRNLNELRGYRHITINQDNIARPIPLPDPIEAAYQRPAVPDAPALSEAEQAESHAAEALLGLVRGARMRRHANPPARLVNQEETQCSWCTNTLGANNIHIRTACNHEFHLYCCILFFTENYDGGCPTCDAPIEIYDPIDRSNNMNRLIGLNRAATDEESSYIDRLRNRGNIRIIDQVNRDNQAPAAPAAIAVRPNLPARLVEPDDFYMRFTMPEFQGVIDGLTEEQIDRYLNRYFASLLPAVRPAPMPANQPFDERIRNWDAHFASLVQPIPHHSNLLLLRNQHNNHLPPTIEKSKNSSFLHYSSRAVAGLLLGLLMSNELKTEENERPKKFPWRRASYVPFALGSGILLNKVSPQRTFDMKTAGSYFLGVAAGLLLPKVESLRKK